MPVTNPAEIFAVNTYSYTVGWTAADCVSHLADQGYPGFEVMMYPGHLWPTDTAAAPRLVQALERTGTRLVATNMPNVDLNVAGASEEMRAYSIDLICRFIALSGDIGAPAIVLGPGKANPLFPDDREVLKGRFFRALDRFAPVAEKGGVRLLIENIAFAFLPDAPSLLRAVEEYGHDGIGIIYDVANAHFIGEDPCEGLRLVRDRLGLVHFSDTGRSVYRHDPVGMGDVPFAAVPPVLAEVGYAELPVLEVISRTPDADTLDSACRLAEAGFGAAG